jgi:uncharacterized protein with HEPN domain
MTTPKTDRVYLAHILQAAEKVVEYTCGITEKGFEAEEMRQKAVIRDLEIIGEATKKLSQKTLESNPSIPWRQMARMRDKLIHDYMGVDMKTVWDTARMDIPVLLRAVVTICVDSFQPGQSLQNWPGHGPLG